MRTRSFSVAASPRYKEIMDLYSNRGERSKYEIYKQACSLDPKLLGRAGSFYRWAKHQDSMAKALEIKMIEGLAVDELSNQIDKKRLIRLAKELGMKELATLKVMSQNATIRERIQIAALALQAIKLEQAEESLAVGDIHHQEKLNQQERYMDAGATPPDVIVEYREGSK